MKGATLDDLIARLPAEQDGDLMLCEQCAYQRDMTSTIAYDEAYYRKCANKDESAIADLLNSIRIEFVARHYAGTVLDVGIGSGEFLRLRGQTFGFDVNPVAIEWLKRRDLWSEHLDHFGALTFWDVLEHLEDPGAYLRRVQLHAFVFASVPIFSDVRAVRASKHYRPGEHLYYWTRDGFVEWMQAQGFLLLEANDYETRAGRESIISFAFKRNRWPR